VTGPLSPTAEPTDETLFEDAQRPDAKFYLPRYRLAEETVSGKAQFRMRLEQLAQGGKLTIFLEKFPAPALGEAARNAAEIPHSIAATLRALIPVGTSRVQQDLTVQEITFEGGLVKTVLRLDTLAQVTQVFQLLTESSFSTSLIVSRAFRVALPVAADTTAAVEQLTAQVKSLAAELAALDKQIAALDVERQQLMRLVVIRPELRQRLVALQAQMAAVARQRAAKKAELDEKNAQLVALRQQKLYQFAAPILEWTVGPQPFVFPKELHPYIFAGLVPGDAGGAGLTVHQVSWKDRSHSYFQQTLNPRRFYFLPDAFKVKRKSEFPHSPDLTVRFPNPDAPPDTMPVTLEYVAGPVTDLERLEAASIDLKRKVPDPGAEDRKLEFEPLLADATRLFMTLPRGEAGPQVEERKGATIDLRNGILDAVTLPMNDFQGVFDALFGASAVVFQGEAVVELDRSGAIPSEHIPVVCRLADLDGDVIDIDEKPDATSGGIKATLRNSIESPLEVHGLKARVVRGDAEVDGIISGLSFDPAIVMKPGASVRCDVTPVSPLSGTGDPIAVFDLDNVKVQPDASAVWDAIVDKSRLPEFTRTIKVKTIKQTFDPRPENPSDPIVAVVLDFERGDSIDLTADKLEAEAKVRLPLEDFVVRRLQSGEYRYKVTVIRVNGGQKKDADWRTDTTGILFPQMVTGSGPQ
jgi:hypothetical protein